MGGTAMATPTRGGYPWQEPQMDPGPRAPSFEDVLLKWLAMVGMGQAVSGSPNPEDTLRRIEESRRFQALWRSGGPGRIPGSPRTTEM